MAQFMRKVEALTVTVGVRILGDAHGTNASVLARRYRGQPVEVVFASQLEDVHRPRLKYIAQVGDRARTQIPVLANRARDVLRLVEGSHYLGLGQRAVARL